MPSKLNFSMFQDASMFGQDVHELDSLPKDLAQLQQNSASLQSYLTNRSGMFANLNQQVSRAFGASPETPNPFYLLGMNPETGVESPEVEAYLASHNRNDSLSQVLLAARELTSTPLAREAVIAELRGEPTEPGFTVHKNLL